MRFLLIHGGWQGGWCWDEVASALRSAGHEVHHPTLRGQESGDVDRAGVTLTEITRRLADHVEELDLTDFWAVGHSGGGPVIQGLVEALPDRIAGVTFVDAWVLQDGQSIYDVLPPEFAASLHAMADSVEDRAILLPAELWREGLINDVPAAEADRWLDRLVPCPEGWMTDPAALPTFHALDIPHAYVFLDEDVTVPRAVYESMAQRLRNPRTTTCPGAHEAMLTRPAELAEALLRVTASD